MPLYNSDYLKNLATKNKRLFESEQRTFSDKRIPESTIFDIFLSHSFLDKDEVQGLYQELTDFGFKVYVDWIVDPHLDRTNVTKSSAKLVQSRLKASRTLLLAISTNATMSKWMPWELGYVDGNTNKCAIIPVSKERDPVKAFKGTEYLLLYPFIKKAPTNKGKDKLWVIENEHSYVVFDSWIKNGRISHNRDVNIYNI
ncbi:toll/interleukin-1 receptor domain-containing protein [Empedobacter sp.]|uniref:toll/interleukin-1 receptor domain-containing protein n=1 Tax=Empedobacter sp. TaxID=1927715 RepID=UPI0028B08944|nr:toll/interleukin-1 receptor domain-containing protein [Empedobacter sp.]